MPLASPSLNPSRKREGDSASRTHGTFAAEGAPTTAASATSSCTSKTASASARQNSSSSAVARQFSGVMMMPANWQAQCSVAASQRFCSRLTT